MKALAAIRRSGGFLRIPLALIVRSGLFGSFEFMLRDYCRADAVYLLTELLDANLGLLDTLCI